MARVTIEDCLKHVDNRFELVFVATQRSRQIIRQGIDPLVPRENDKATVIALREIAEGLHDKNRFKVAEEAKKEEVKEEAVIDGEQSTTDD